MEPKLTERRFVKASTSITCNLALLNYKHVYNAIYNLYIEQNTRRCNILNLCLLLDLTKCLYFIKVHFQTVIF